jgi:hypothetical protein
MCSYRARRTALTRMAALVGRERRACPYLAYGTVARELPFAPAPPIRLDLAQEQSFAVRLVPRNEESQVALPALNW